MTLQIAFTANWFTTGHHPLFLAPVAFLTPHCIPLFKSKIDFKQKYFTNPSNSNTNCRINCIINEIFHSLSLFFLFCNESVSSLTHHVNRVPCVLSHFFLFCNEKRRRETNVKNMLTRDFNYGYDEGKSLKPLTKTHKPALDGLYLCLFLRRECANILNKHTRS